MAFYGAIFKPRRSAASRPDGVGTSCGIVAPRYGVRHRDLAACTIDFIGAGEREVRQRSFSNKDLALGSLSNKSFESRLATDGNRALACLVSPFIYLCR
jgi:hypothetical protein